MSALAVSRLVPVAPAAAVRGGKTGAPGPSQRGIFRSRQLVGTNGVSSIAKRGRVGGVSVRRAGSRGRSSVAPRASIEQAISDLATGVGLPCTVSGVGQGPGACLRPYPVRSFSYSTRRVTKTSFAYTASGWARRPLPGLSPILSDSYASRADTLDVLPDAFSAFRCKTAEI